MSFKKILLLIILIAFTVTRVYNISILKSNNYLPGGGDASDFLHLSTSLAKTGKYGHLKLPEKSILLEYSSNNIKTNNYIFNKHNSWRPPFWPALMAIVLKATNYNLINLFLIKLFFEILALIIFFKICLLLKINKTLSLLGVLVLSIHPALLIYSRTLLTESFTLCVMIFFVYYLLKLINIKNRKYLIKSGVLGGVLLITHPSLLFFPFMITFLFAIFKYIKIKKLILLWSFFILIIGVWVVRNMYVYNTTNIIITTSSSSSIAKGWNSEVLSNYTNTQGDLADDMLEARNYGIFKENLSEVEKMHVQTKASTLFINENAHLIHKIIFKKLYNSFYPFAQTNKKGLLETGREMFHFLAFIALILLFFLKQNKRMNIIIFSMYVSMALMTVITYSGFRFRMPLISFELIMIIYVIQVLIDKNVKRLI